MHSLTSPATPPSTPLALVPDAPPLALVPTSATLTFGCLTLPPGSYFPVAEKKPLAKGWQDWTGAIAPGAAYAIKTGPQSGIWVLDLDQKNGKDGNAAIERWAEENDCELPETFTVKTPSGGYHIYFQDDERVGNRTGILEGVDSRGKGGYAVGPESPGYTIVVDLPVAKAPEELIELVIRKATSVTTVSAIAIPETHPEFDWRCNEAAKWLAGCDPCISGQGGQAQIWKVANELSRGFELPISKSLELLELSAGFNSRCVPPWGQVDLKRQLTRAAETGEKVPGWRSKGFAEFCGKVATPLHGANAFANVAKAAPLSEWRQRKNPDHQYKFDVAMHIAGTSDKVYPISQRELTSSLTGPGAHPDWCGVWQMDLFANRMVAVNPPLKLNAEKGCFDATDVANIQMWYECSKGSKITDAMLDKAVRTAASGAALHPVREYLRGLTKPATAHLASPDLAERLFGSTPEDAPQVVDFLRRWMIGCVARVMQPGAQFDTVLTLLGPGGYRKTTFFKYLAVEPDWYRGNIPDIADPQKVGLALRQKWIVELGELTAMRSSQRGAFLEFISRTEENFRAPYERGEVSERRQCGIGATANELEFLSEWDGATQRRFLPIEVKKVIDTDWVTAHRDELWAEAFAAYLAGEQWWVKDESTLASAKTSFMSTSPLQERVEAFLSDNAARAKVDGLSTTRIYELVVNDLIHPRLPTLAERDALSRVLRIMPGVASRQGKGNKRYLSVRPLGLDGVPQPDADRQAAKEESAKRRVEEEQAHKVRFVDRSAGEIPQFFGEGAKRAARQ